MSDQLKEKQGECKRELGESGIAFLEGEYIPLKKGKVCNFARIRKYLIQRLASNDIQILNMELKSIGLSENFIFEFFKEEGYTILHWLLVSAPSRDSFLFVLSIFPRELFKKELKENDFSLLKSVLNGRAGMEELGLLSTQRRKLDIEKFELLLQLDQDGIQEFMAKNKTATFMKPSTWEDYELALQSYNATKRHGAIPPTP